MWPRRGSNQRRDSNASAVTTIALYALLAVVVIPIYPHAASPNEVSRWIVAVAIVDFHTVEVTPVVKSTGVLTGDLAEYNGRLYSNKAPGGALLVVPVYAMVRPFIGPPSADTLRATLTTMRLFGATLPTILLAFWFARVSRKLGCSEGRTGFAVTVLLFATPIFTYGLLFFAHALSALTIFGAWVLLFLSERTRWNDLGAGALIGMAVLCESVAVFPAAVLIACALPRLHLTGTLRLIAGGVPFAVALIVYNELAFDAWFAVPLAYDMDPNVRALHRSGWHGLHWPSLTFFTDLLVDSSKGLLVLSPILLIALAGIAPARRVLPLSAVIALIGASLAVLLSISAYPYWFGGRGVGARYLMTMVPFLALLVALARETMIEPLLAGASAFTIAVMSLVFPFIPTMYAVPWVSFSLPLLAHGCIVPNLFHFVWRPLALVFPFAIVAAALFFSLPQPRALLLLVAGAMLWLGIGFVAEARRPSPSFQRVLAEEVHFEHHGVIARTFPPGHPVTLALQRRAEELKRLPPPSWPF
jgi:hypothetical protein